MIKNQGKYTIFEQPHPRGYDYRAAFCEIPFCVISLYKQNTLPYTLQVKVVEVCLFGAGRAARKEKR